MSEDTDIRTRACAGGPLLVRGASTWTDEQGQEHPVTRPVVAVCRCGLSQRAPWCDGTHTFTPGGPLAAVPQDTPDPDRDHLPGAS